MKIEKRKVWVINIFFKTEDSEGEPIGFMNPSDEYFANTYEDAVKIRDRILNDEDYFYGLEEIEDCYISDEPEERKFLV